jgi:hypothetical protein
LSCIFANFHGERFLFVVDFFGEKYYSKQ